MQANNVRLQEAFDSFLGFTEVPDAAVAAVETVAERPVELASFQPRILARTALAAASVMPPNTVVLSAVCERICEEDLVEFEPGDITTFVWAIAAAAYDKDVVVEKAMVAVGHQLADRAWEFSPKELAQTTLAFAEIRVRHEAMLATIQMEVMWKIDQFSAHSLASMVSACASLGVKQEAMYDWVAARVVGRLQDYNAVDLSNVLWAFAEVSVKNDALANAIAGKSAEASEASKFGEEEYSRIMWALGKLNCSHSSFDQPLYNLGFKSS